MASTKTTVFMSGKVYWAKILGAPVPNYNRDGKEWTLEFEPDADGLKALKAQKLGDRLKDKGDGRAPYITLKKSELSQDGTPNAPIRVYNSDNEDWDKNTLIGNGSSGDIKLDIRDYGVGKKKGIYPVALRITEHVPYQSSEFGSMDKADGKPVKAKEAIGADFGVEDDVV